MAANEANAESRSVDNEKQIQDGGEQQCFSLADHQICDTLNAIDACSTPKDNAFGANDKSDCLVNAVIETGDNVAAVESDNIASNSLVSSVDTPQVVDAIASNESRSTVGTRSSSRRNSQRISSNDNTVESNEPKTLNRRKNVPRKSKVETNVETKRKRGRPKKVVQQQQQSSEDDEEGDEDLPTESSDDEVVFEKIKASAVKKRKQPKRIAASANVKVTVAKNKKCKAVVENEIKTLCKSKIDSRKGQKTMNKTKAAETKVKMTKSEQKKVKIERMKAAKSSKCQVFFCDKCDKVYDQYSELVYHLRRHTGEKPFQCTWPGCKKAFSASNARVRHLRTHTGEKPYVCPLPDCGRRFTYWKDLKLHKYRHTGEKPHKCDWEGCLKKINYILRLKIKFHKSGERPYKCPWPGCGSAFSQKSPLNLHMRKTHKNENTTKNSTVASNQASPNKPAALVLLPNYQPTSHAINPPSLPYSHQAINTNAVVNHTQFGYNASVIGVATAPSNDSSNPVLLTCHVSPHEIAPSTQNISPTFLASNINSWNNHQQSFHVDNNISQNQIAIRQVQANSCFELKNQQQCENINEQQATVANISADLRVATTAGENMVRTYTRVPKPLDAAAIDASISNEFKQNPRFREVALGPDSVEFKYVTDLPIKAPLPPDATKLPDTIDAAVGNESSATELASLIPKPVRKRANYRLKVRPAEGANTPTSVTVITKVSPVKRKPIQKSTEELVTKRPSKRTIAVQTTRRSLKLPKGTLHECDICKRTFKAKHDRDCHRMTHTGEKPRACDWPGCDYRCITKSERNYPCDWPGCEKKFATSRHMKEHKRSHTGEKPFKCDWPGCDKWFSRKDHIKNHRFTHTGEKPRKCPFPGCESAFIQLSPLKKHMELHKRDGGNVPNRTRKRKVVVPGQECDPTKTNSTPAMNNHQNANIHSIVSNHSKAMSFTFGAPITTTATISPFGSLTAAQSTTANTGSGLSAFGAFGAQQTPSTGFTFGATPATTVAAASGTGFTFGSPLTVPQTTQQPTGFTFGALSTPAAATTATAASTVAPFGSTFSFGTPQTTQQSTGFSFGTSTPVVSTAPAATGFGSVSFGTIAPQTTTTASAGFSFGVTPATTVSATPAFGNTTPFSFGTTQPTPQTATTQTLTFSFPSTTGATALATTTTSQQPFSFSTPAATTSAPASTIFGVNTTSQTTSISLSSAAKTTAAAVTITSQPLTTPATAVTTKTVGFSFPTATTAATTSIGITPQTTSVVATTTSLLITAPTTATTTTAAAVTPSSNQMTFKQLENHINI
ncbi:hypothetical protein B4U79_08702, partial [Dinothrombium tinctorium]